MKGAIATVEICVLCGWRFLNHFDVVSETPCSCDTAGCELWRVIASSLLCPETDWKIRVGKKGYMFILTDPVKRNVSMFHSWHQSVSTIILRLRIFEIN